MSNGPDRREFVRRALEAGFGLPVVSAALAACRDEVRPPAGSPARLERALAIYNWSDYIGDDTVAGFEREFGVRVTYDTYESNEELLAKLQAGAAGYDLVCPTGYAVTVLRALDLLAPLDRSLLDNWRHLSPVFTGQPADPENRFTVPWHWGMAGLAFRRDLVPAPPDSWGVFHDASFRGKMTQLDDMRDVIGAWLRFRGRSLNSKDQAELVQARGDALRAKANLKSYVSAPVKGQLIAGDVWIAHMWNGDTMQAKGAEPAIDFVTPAEGSMIYLDSMAIPRTAPHPRAAHEFLNYILRPDVAAAIADRTGYGSPNAAGLAIQRRPLPPPTTEELRRLEYQEDLGEATELWDRIWTEIKAG
jgi:spermidine/putrescine-binding protein